MNNLGNIELFLLKCAVIEADIRQSTSEYKDNPKNKRLSEDSNNDRYIRQFSLQNRRNASNMAEYYELFYMLENDIRELIVETLESAHGANWWDLKVPTGVKEEARKNRNRKEQAAVSTRSDNEIDYITFGQLSDVIRENWVDFAGIMSNQSAVSRVLSALNMLRGTIAHCGVLADDEVDRLKLAIKDWFRVLEGPKSS
ncbi:Swt1 family HEPN domain-containing protein [Oharaeibacter diazotrophicus]|uniref:Swt1-like HEPN domain-containing protein n=1 Tax=Oharaeibacter diazotrophicus TaxID=1920512 RepID=A0A4R6RH18_9HYPH|nr:Swt1 family HEPN domain-containing protein [Oharaeibacter diazotrophicus]TDP85630.1 hypothetical protein EDD54_2486 [Oharaeibacter diazotrophicus]GLS75699.1 hypothetical protein GCM10007904_10340 [Oharaeibacter diazotrophicus]